MLSIEKMCKNYGTFSALSEVSFEIKPGSIVGYLGPNGAGKSTTLRILTLSSRVTRGDVLFEGKSIFSNQMLFKSRMGYVADIPFLYPMLTGREFLNFVADMRQIPVSNRKNIEEFLSMFDMVKDSERLISGYSLGMKRKISVIAALLHRPSILFLDEPTSGLDAISVRQFKVLLAKLKDEGVSILLTTHILEIVEKLCDFIVIINKGKIVSQGTLPEIKNLSAKVSQDLEEVFLAVTGNQHD